jgi:[acyl-carrier-protein] S-malonyltransferase
MAIAWVFPGQGSQKVGMADPLLNLSGAHERFSQASELLGRDLLAICQGESGRGPNFTTSPNGASKASRTRP